MDDPRRLAKLATAKAFSTWALVLPVPLRYSATLLLDGLGERGVGRLEFMGAPGWAGFGFPAFDLKASGWFAIESLRLSMDDAFLDSDAGYVRYASVCALAFRDGAQGVPLRWYMPFLWHGMHHRSGKNRAKRD